MTLTLRDLERMEAEARAEIERLFAEWMQGFLGSRATRGQVIDVQDDENGIL